jgi:hypothetical protein
MLTGMSSTGNSVRSLRASSSISSWARAHVAPVFNLASTSQLDCDRGLFRSRVAQ